MRGCGGVDWCFVNDRVDALLTAEFLTGVSRNRVCAGSSMRAPASTALPSASDSADVLASIRASSASTTASSASLGPASGVRLAAAARRADCRAAGQVVETRSPGALHCAQRRGTACKKGDMSVNQGGYEVKPSRGFQLYYNMDCHPSTSAPAGFEAALRPRLSTSTKKQPVHRAGRWKHKTSVENSRDLWAEICDQWACVGGAMGIIAVSASPCAHTVVSTSTCRLSVGRDPLWVAPLAVARSPIAPCVSLPPSSELSGLPQPRLISRGWCGK